MSYARNYFISSTWYLLITMDQEMTVEKIQEKFLLKYMNWKLYYMKTRQKNLCQQQLGTLFEFWERESFIVVEDEEYEGEDEKEIIFLPKLVESEIPDLGKAKLKIPFF